MPVNEKLIIELQANVDKYKKEIASAGKVTADTQKGIETSLNKVTQAIRNQSDTLGKGSKSFDGFGRNAGMAGIQLQQFFGQVQGGQSVLLALSQQATDLGFVLGAAGLGAAVGIGATALSFLIAAFNNTTDVMKDANEELEKLIKNYGELSKEGKEATKALISNNIKEQEEKLSDLEETLAETMLSIQALKSIRLEEEDSIFAWLAPDKGELKDAQDAYQAIQASIAAVRLKIKEYKAELSGLDGKDSTETESTEKIQARLNRQLAVSSQFIEQSASFNNLMAEMGVMAADAETELNRQKNEKLIQQNSDKNQAILDQEERAAKLRKRQIEQQALAEQMIKLSSARSIISGLASLNSAFLDDNKAFNAGLIVADTAAAAMAAYKAGASTGIPGAGEAAAFKAIATGAAQLAANNSAQKGGGSIGGSGGGVSTQSQSEPEQPTIGVSVSDLSTGITEQRIIISTDDGRDIFDGISKGVEESRVNNRT